MGQFFIFILTVALVLVSIFTVCIILMQQPTSNAGLGSALGGGAAEIAFGGETTKILNKWTVYGTILFFIISFVLSMLHISSRSEENARASLPNITITK